MDSAFPDGYLDHFPPVKNAFAYGSAVFSQGVDAHLVDLIFIVDDAKRWHAENLTRNPSHYSGLRFLGPRAVNTVNHWGPKVYFNAFIHLPGLRECKYGVIEERYLLDDLRVWTYLYLAGRLHKPVAFASRLTDALSQAKENNRTCALRVALLLLPERIFTLPDLLYEICNISYRGDVRNGVAENPRKVWNIVDQQGDLLENIYRPLFPRLDITGKESLSFDGRREDLRATLPPFLRTDKLRDTLRQRVFLSSLYQTQKGILTNGPMRSLRYVAAKFGKRLHS